MTRTPALAREYIGVVGRSLARAITGRSGPVDPSVFERARAARLFWLIHTYRDWPKLETNLAALRHLYPESAALVISDGDPDPSIPPLCGRYGVGFRLGARLFAVEHGGEIVQRMLDEFLARDADILIKIDPDTALRRGFTRMPPAGARAIFGTIGTNETGDCEFIQGGCMIVPRRVAEEVTARRLLVSDRLKPPALEWAASAISTTRAAAGLTSIDQTFGWACRELAIPCVNHPEVFSRYLPSLVDLVTSLRLAVYHPRFERRDLARSNFYFGGIRSTIRRAWQRDQSATPPSRR